MLPPSPYATQQGEISFCAYNTEIGWRNIVEKMHMTATLTKRYEEHGRHEILAGGKSVPLNSPRFAQIQEPPRASHRARSGRSRVRWRTSGTNRAEHPKSGMRLRAPSEQRQFAKPGWSTGVSASQNLMPASGVSTRPLPE
jgi:hypothetical protein